MVLVGEPYDVDLASWHFDSTGRATVDFHSCYASPSMFADEFQQFPSCFEASERRYLIISGYFKARLAFWGDRGEGPLGVREIAGTVTPQLGKQTNGFLEGEGIVRRYNLS